MAEPEYASNGFLSRARARKAEESKAITVVTDASAGVGRVTAWGSAQRGLAALLARNARTTAPPFPGRRRILPRGTMTSHKFTVGQTVSFSHGRQQQRPGGALFKIVRLLPEAGDALQYRVKSETDGHERVVREDQLARA
jgi:hypothetical protein